MNGTMDWKEGWLPVEYIDEGQEVWMAWPKAPGSAVRCTVACAAGYHARVVNSGRAIDCWVHVRDLRRRAVAGAC